jgi:hypothetical protein
MYILCTLVLQIESVCGQDERRKLSNKEARPDGVHLYFLWHKVLGLFCKHGCG